MMVHSEPPAPSGVSGRHLLGGGPGSGWGDVYGPATDMDGNWCSMSLDSNELNKMPSPFDDIGYLATNVEQGKSFKMRDGCGAAPSLSTGVAAPPPSSSRGSNGGTATNLDKGPSLNEFLSTGPPKTSFANGTKTAQAKSVTTDGAPLGRRGQLQRKASRRGDIGNQNIDDDQSIGISTIASRFTIRSKAARNIFDISKNSITLSMIGGGNKSSKNDSKSFGGSRHMGTDPSNHSKQSVSVSKTSRTMTSTSRNGSSSFGSSMFSRDPSKSKEKMREAIDQLQAANKSLITDKRSLLGRVEELTNALEKASFLHEWFSVIELAEVNTQLCQFRAKYERVEREHNELEEFAMPLVQQVDMLLSRNKAQDERIAYLEAKLIENEVFLSQHGIAGGSQGTLESANSFASFECDDDESYEVVLKAPDGESTVASNDDDKRQGDSTNHNRNNSESKDRTQKQLDCGRGLDIALNMLATCNDQQVLETLEEMAEDLDSSASVFTKKSSESANKKKYVPQKNSWLMLDTKMSDESSKQAKYTAQKDSWLTLDTKLSNESEKETKQSSCSTLGADGFKAPRKETNSRSGMALEDYMQKAIKSSTKQQEAMETGTWAHSDDIISVLPETKNEKIAVSQPLPPPPPPSGRCYTDPSNSSSRKRLVKDRKWRSKSPKSPARRKKNTGQAVNEANNNVVNLINEPASALTTKNTLKESNEEGVQPVISTSRVFEKPRQVRSSSAGTRRKLTRESSSRKMNQSDHVTMQTKAPPRRTRSFGSVPVPGSTPDEVASSGEVQNNANRIKAVALSEDISLSKTLKQPSRRRLKNPDPLGGSSHSNKSSKRRSASIGKDMRANSSSHSVGSKRQPQAAGKDMFTAGACSNHSVGGRRPPLAGKDLFAAGSGSNHSAGGRRRRSSTVSADERRTVSDAMDRILSTKPMVIVNDNAATTIAR